MSVQGLGSHQTKVSEEWKGAWTPSSFQTIGPTNRKPFRLLFPLNK